MGVGAAGVGGVENLRRSIDGALYSTPYEVCTCKILMDAIEKI